MKTEKSRFEVVDEAEALVALVRTPSNRLEFRKDCEREAYRFARNTLPQLLQMVSSPSVESAGSVCQPALDGGEEAAKFLPGIPRSWIAWWLASIAAGGALIYFVGRWLGAF